MKLRSRLPQQAAVLALAALLLFSGCSEKKADSTSEAADASSAAASVSEDALSDDTSTEIDAFFASLTNEEMDQLVSGTTTLEQLEEKHRTAIEQAAQAAAGEAASSSTAQETPAASSSSVSAGTAAASTYDAELRALLSQLYDVKARAESGLNSAIASAKSEYKALPEDQKTQAKKVSIVMSKTSELNKLQSSCDKEVNDIVAKMRKLLEDNGQSTELADQALASYEAQKQSTYSSLKSQLLG